MELSEQEMELFLLFSELWSKNFFSEIFLNFANEFKAVFFLLFFPLQFEHFVHSVHSEHFEHFVHFKHFEHFHHYEHF